MRNAKQIFIKHYLKRRVKDKTLRHTIRVVDLCCDLKDLFESVGFRVNWEYLEAAAWLHDIAKEKKNHQNYDVVKNALRKYSSSLNVNIDDVAYIIQFHKFEDCERFTPQKYVLECAILCICDKLDKLNKTRENAIKNHWKTQKYQDEMLKDAKKCRKYLQKIYDGNVLSHDEFDLMYVFSVFSIKKLLRHFTHHKRNQN